MRARRSIDRRALSYIELGWGVSGDTGPCETLLPIDDAEALVRESGILKTATGLWLQVVAEASHVVRKKPETAPSQPDAATGAQQTAEEPQTVLSFAQFMSSYQRYIRFKTNFSTPTASAHPADEPSDFTSLVHFEKGDGSTVHFSQRLVEYTKKKINEC